MPTAVLRTPSPAELTASRTNTLERRNARPSKLRHISPTESVDGDGDRDADMAGRIPATNFDDDEGEEGRDEYGDDEENQGYVGGGGNFLPQADMDPEDEEDVLADIRLEDIKEDDAPFKEGAILRISVENFLTYKAMEVKMGPGLNMIIGPNGTGKSSIVCAICLGLGWAPSVLGRSKDLGDFVKHGESEGFIEIELQRKKGEKKNPIIKRRLIKEGNASSWWINGAVSTNAKVIKLAKSYNIQIDNLCTFLPQDKVAEFAKITPPDRLRATLRAAAPPEMLEKHDELVELGKSATSLRDSLEADGKRLKGLEDRQKLDEAMVQRVRDREKFQSRIELLKLAKPIITYNNAHAETKRAKAEVKEQAEILKQMHAAAAPELEKPQLKEEYKERLERVLQQRVKTVQNMQKNLRELKEGIDKIHADISANTAQMNAEEKAFHTRRQEIEKLKDRIRRIKDDLAAGPPDVDVTDLNTQLAAIRTQTHEKDAQYYELEEKYNSFHQHIDQIERRMKGAEAELQRMNSLDGQREQMLRKNFPDAARFWDHIQQNKSRLKQEVFPPAILNCSIAPPHAIDAIETLIGRHCTSFVTQNMDDYYTLTEMAFGNKDKGIKGLPGIADITIRDYSRTRAPTLHQQNTQGPIPREQLAPMGFAGYAIDYIKGPDLVLNMLCHEASINKIPIAFNNMTQQQQTDAEHAGFSVYINGPTITQIFSRYGITSSKSQGIRSANMFKMQGIDRERKSELERSINQSKHELNEVKEERQSYKTRMNELRIEKQQLEAEKGLIEAEKKKKRDAETDYKKAAGRLKSFEQELENKKRQAASYKDVAAELNAKAHELACVKAQESLRYAGLVTELVDAHDGLVQINLRALEAASDLKILEANVAQIQRNINLQKREVDRLHETAARAIAKGRALKEEVQAILTRCDDEMTESLKNIAQQQTDMSVVDREIAELETQLSLLHGGQEGVLERYEVRARQIEKLRKTVERQAEQHRGVEAAITEVLSQWEPKLEALVERVSRAFSQSFGKINCGGEVRIHRAKEGFDKWAIDILVKFREEENLQILDSHRQSGGERAVTTVFYLMALQSLAQSPFRVVDEINQGMDPRNERVVHHRMVNVACQTNTSQYFLITPKLLSDLVYHPRMKVHCVYSGDWLTQNMVMDFKKYLAAGRKMKAQKSIAAR